MVDIREYLRKKEKNGEKDSKDFKREIRAHRLKVILRSWLRNRRDRSADGDGGNTA